MRIGGQAEADGSALVEELMRSASAALNERLVELTSKVTHRIASEIDQLGGDEHLMGLLQASVEANLETVLHILQHGIEVASVETPSAAVEYARRLAQRGVVPDALLRAYRLGQDTVLGWFFEELQRQGGDADELSAAAQRIVGTSFAYIDRVSQQVVAIYTEERDRWLQDRSAVRAARIREVLNEQRIDVPATEAALGYRLVGRRHLGVVAWWGESGDGPAGVSGLERHVRELAENLGCDASPLFVPCDQYSGWAWLPIGSDVPGPEEVRRALPTGQHAARITMGDAGRDVDGFRRTHRQALDTQTAAQVAGAGAPRLTCFAELGPVALLCRDIPATQAWVVEVLGRLGVDDENHERLRDTLRVFLACGGSYTAAAGKLALHKNSVQYRVRKAEEERGRPIRDDRLGVEVALAAAHWLGAAVLRRPE